MGNPRTYPDIHSSGKCPRAAVQSSSPLLPPPLQVAAHPLPAAAAQICLLWNRTMEPRSHALPVCSLLSERDGSGVAGPCPSAPCGLRIPSRADGHGARGSCPPRTLPRRSLRACFPFFGAYPHSVSQCVRKLPKCPGAAAQRPTSHPRQRTPDARHPGQHRERRLQYEAPCGVTWGLCGFNELPRGYGR